VFTKNEIILSELSYELKDEADIEIE